MTNQKPEFKNIFDLRPDYQMRVGVMGSASGTVMRNQKAIEASRKVGATIAAQDGILVNGACPGLPDEAALGAKEAGGTTFGVSPAISVCSHIRIYKSPIDHYDSLLFTGLGLMMRDIINIRSSNAVIILPGGTGTLNEFTVAYDEGKPIGVLTGVGGCADHIKEILAACHRPADPEQIIFDSDPESLVIRLMELTRLRPVAARLDDHLVGEEGEVTKIEAQFTEA